VSDSQTIRPIPKWKLVDCPTCKAVAGESCGRPMLGAPWVWQRTARHNARSERAAAAIGNKLEKSDE